MKDGIGRNPKCTREQFSQFLRVARVLITWRDPIRYAISRLSSVVARERFDILQPAFAALTSGAYHPTAEAHAIVADHVMRHVRQVLDKENAPVVAKGVN